MLEVTAQEPIYIIVDALDECPKLSGMPTPRAMVLSLLKDLVGLRFRNLHICVTSRPEVDILNFMGPLARSVVSLHEERGQMKDIYDYIHNVVYSDNSDSMMRTWRSDQKELVIKELSKKADGMYAHHPCSMIGLLTFALQVPMGILSAGGAATLFPGKHSTDAWPFTRIVGRDLPSRAPSDP